VNSDREISEQINRRHTEGINGFPTTRSPDAVRRKMQRDGLSREAPETYSQTENPYVDRWRVLRELQEQYKEESIEANVGRPENADTKILCISDIHFPFARLDYIEQILEAHPDADIVVLNGDIIDGHIFSTFEKHKTIAAIDEYRCAFNFVRTLSEAYPKVVLNEGNHDVRPARAMRSAGFKQAANQVLRPNLIARIANGEMLDSTGLVVEKLDFDNVHYDPYEPWYTRIGKAIIAHPHGRGSSRPGYTVSRVAQYFNQRYGAGEIDTFVCGHTHKIYKGVVSRQLLIEQGCLEDVTLYAHSPKLQYTGTGENGYAVLYQDAKGNTDFNKSGPIFLGELLPPKKSIQEI